MIFAPTTIDGVLTVDIDRHVDERGFFARTFCVDELTAHGLLARFAQQSISYNKVRGTLRGMHYQTPPYAETKIVACIRGAIYDVALDLRPTSQTFRQWLAIELNESNRRMLYIPPGVAHGFQSLADDTVVQYQITPAYVPGHAGGVRWNDPAFHIDWPIREPVLSQRDRAYEDFEL